MPTLTDHLELPASIGAALRRQRQSAGLTTAEVADAAGFSPRFLFLIENAQPLTGTGAEEVLAGIERVCAVLEMDPEPLLASAGRALSKTMAGAKTVAGAKTAGAGADPPTSIDFRPDPTTGQADEPTGHTLVPVVAYSDVIPTGRRGGRRAPGRRRHPTGGAWALRLATAGAALAVIATAVALVLVGGRTPGIPSATAAAASTRTATHPAAGPLVPGLDPTSPESATLAVGAPRYKLTVTTAAPCWVEIRSAGGEVLWAGTLSAGQRETYTAHQPTELQLGAGSARLIVSWGSHRYTLTPAVAPYTYSLRS